MDKLPEEKLNSVQPDYEAMKSQLPEPILVENGIEYHFLTS
jgi:hypothetical protein